MDFLFGADMPLAVQVLPRIHHRARADRRHRLPGSPLRRRAGSARHRAGRQPRLAVIDAAAVDGRRRLVLIRRDNVEHLLMIGGPTDVVVEANIVRAAAPAREAPPRDRPRRRPTRCRAPCRSAKATCGRCSRRPSLHRRLRQPAPRPHRQPPMVDEPMQWHPEPEPPPHAAACRRGGTSRAWSRVNRGPSRARPIRSPDWLPNSRAIRRRSRGACTARRVPRANATSRRLREPERARSSRRRRLRLLPRPHRPSKSRRRRTPTRTSPRWRSGWKPRCAARTPSRAHRARAHRARTEARARDGA